MDDEELKMEKVWDPPQTGGSLRVRIDRYSV
jgi:hypothetical protein